MRIYSLHHLTVQQVPDINLTILTPAQHKGVIHTKIRSNPVILIVMPLISLKQRSVPLVKQPYGTIEGRNEKPVAVFGLAEGSYRI